MKGVRETADALSDSSAEKTAKLHPSFRIVVLQGKRTEHQICQGNFCLTEKTALFDLILPDTFAEINRKSRKINIVFMEISKWQ